MTFSSGVWLLQLVCVALVEFTSWTVYVPLWWFVVAFECGPIVIPVSDTVIVVVSELLAAGAVAPVPIANQEALHPVITVSTPVAVYSAVPLDAVFATAIVTLARCVIASVLFVTVQV